MCAVIRGDANADLPAASETSAAETSHSAPGQRQARGGEPSARSVHYIQMVTDASHSDRGAGAALQRLSTVFYCAAERTRLFLCGSEARPGMARDPNETKEGRRAHHSLF